MAIVGVIGVRAFTHDLRPAGSARLVSFGHAPPLPEQRDVVQTGGAEAFARRVDGQIVLHRRQPVSVRSGRSDGALAIAQLASAAARAHASARDLWIRLGVLAMAAVAVVVLEREVVGPLRRLLAGVRRVWPRSGEVRVSVKRRHELGRVAAGVDDMTALAQHARREGRAETERILELEQQLRHAQTLAVAGKLASGLAHEIGTPLNIISGRAEFLLQGLAGHDPRRTELTGIIDQIDRISGIIRSLLDVVRSSAPEVRAVGVDEVLATVWPLMAHAARRRGVVLTSAVPVTLPRILADSNQLQQVVINLLMNAFEASARGSAVAVTAEARRHNGRDGVAVSVCDEGAGIAPAVRARIFEPFFSTKPPGQGTGLGLPISRDIVRQHGGDITVDGRPGAGTAVTVWLPCGEAA